jgi:hypothetical protein
LTIVHLRPVCLALLVGGCGIELQGTLEPGSVDAGRVDASAYDAGSPDATAVLAEDAGVAPSDGGGAADGPAITDAAGPDTRPPPPDPTKVSLSFAAGKDAKVYQFDIGTNQFTVLPSAGCPAAEESAVLSDGTIFVTSSDNKNLFRVTGTGCVSVRTNASFPFALGTAPVGTVSPTQEVLIGYMGAGDYVRVDQTNGNVTTITPGALGALRPSGDVTAIGTRGYLAAQSNTGSGAFACPSGGDCIVEVNLLTGAPIQLVKQFVGLGIFGLAHSHGSLLFYANTQVFAFDPVAQTLSPALAGFPAGAAFSGAGAAPFPSP